MFKPLLPLSVKNMTESKAIKVSKETYAELSEIAGELQVKLKRPVSIEEAIKHLTKRRRKGVKISDLAGSWTMTDHEAEEMETAISQAWKKWKLQK
jgi:predicted CopG family antitoxin